MDKLVQGYFTVVTLIKLAGTDSKMEACSQFSPGLQNVAVERRGRARYLTEMTRLF